MLVELAKAKALLICLEGAIKIGHKHLILGSNTLGVICKLQLAKK